MQFSVLMSVYNKEKPLYLEEALRSIYDEQILKPSEIVIVEDGKLTYELYQVINKWKNKLKEKFVIVKLKQNQGLAKALNEGLKYCNYNVVARMDTDDIALPNRFKSQINFLKRNNFNIIGSFYSEFNDKGEVVKKLVKLPITTEEMFEFIKLRNPISHPTVVFKKDKILELGGYSNEFRLGQDIALWSMALANKYKLYNIPEVLLKMRLNDSFFKRRSWKAFKYYIKVLDLQYSLGLIDKKTYYRNIVYRFVLRNSPTFIVKLLYKVLR